jgi:hypothetical protein
VYRLLTISLSLLFLPVFSSVATGLTKDQKLIRKTNPHIKVINVVTRNVMSGMSRYHGWHERYKKRGCPRGSGGVGPW